MTTPETPRRETMTAEDARRVIALAGYRGDSNRIIADRCMISDEKAGLFSRILATYHALAASQKEVEAWRLAAAEVSLAKAGTDVSTPAAFRTAQAKAACGLLAERDEARASLALAQRDSERLDWLDGRRTTYQDSTKAEPPIYEWLVTDEECHIRAAIDAARHAAMSPPPETTQGET